MLKFALNLALFIGVTYLVWELLSYIINYNVEKQDGNDQEPSQPDRSDAP